MARVKKVEKYVPQTPFPKNGHEWRVLEKQGYKMSNYISLLKDIYAKRQEAAGVGVDIHRPYIRFVNRWDAGELTDDNYRERVADYYYRNMAEYVFPCTETFKTVNDAFLAEYDSREDLQEIYKECTKSSHWVYDLDENCIDLGEKSTSPYRERPQSYKMFSYITRRYGRAMIEKARETPYVEGDLVLLRDTAIGSDADPLVVNRWASNYTPGMTTPDKSTKRIGTVISVTDKLSQSWRPVKGSKVMKIMWMGMGDSKVVDVEERWVKFYERPTYKNGMKKREE